MRGEPFEILDFFGHRAERVDFKRLAHGAIIENERHRAQDGAERDTGRRQISQWRIGSGDCQEKKITEDHQPASPIKKIHLGTFQFVASFISPVSEKSAASASKRLRFLLD